MLESIRNFLNTPPGKWVLGFVVSIIVFMVGWNVVSAWNSTPGSNASRDRIFVCSETGKSFHKSLDLGDDIPVYSSYSGKKTGYPAEFCGWNNDGSVRSEPFPLLLNATLGKPGPTFCPDCGRLVVRGNPMPGPGLQPPPTQSEYAKARN